MENKSIWLVVVALVFVLFFGMTFFYLGVLNPAAPTPSTVYGGEYKGGMAASAGRYHVYNPLASAGFLVSFIIGIIIFFWSLIDLRENKGKYPNNPRNNRNNLPLHEPLQLCYGHP